MVDTSNEAVEKLILEWKEKYPQWEKEVLEKLIHWEMWKQAHSHLCAEDYKERCSKVEEKTKLCLCGKLKKLFGGACE